jgi:DNA replication protein DnaC
MRAAAPEVIATAKSQRWDPAEMLRVLLTEEVAGRDRATRAQRRRAAGLPAGKTFDSWIEAKSSIPVPTQSALKTLEWVGRAENLAICGPSGCGGHCAFLPSTLIIRSRSARRPQRLLVFSA